MDLKEYVNSVLDKKFKYGHDKFDCYQLVKGYYPQLKTYRYQSKKDIAILCIQHKVRNVMEQFRKDFKELGFKIVKNGSEGDIVIFKNNLGEEVLGLLTSSGDVVGVNEEIGVTIIKPERLEIWHR